MADDVSTSNERARQSSRSVDGALIAVVLALAVATSADLVDGGWREVAVLAVIAGIGVARRLPTTVAVAGCFAIVAALGQLGQPVVPCVGAALIAIAIARLWGRRDWFVRGRLDRGALAAIAIVSVVATTALIVWTRFNPAAAAAGRDLFPRDRAPAFAVALVFAMINAFGEEVVYRGVVMGAVSRLAGPAVALVAQAIVFGVGHLHGFPSGWIGVGLATIYGLMLGVVRLRTGGLLAAWIAHVAADFTIACLILTS